MFRKISLLAIIIAIIAVASYLYAATQTINTLPSSSATFITDLQHFLSNELPEYDALRHGYASPIVIQGGIGGTAAGLAHTISAVTGFPNSYFVTQAATSHTYTNGTRTFVYLMDSNTRTFTIAAATVTYDSYLAFAEMAAGSATPATPTGCLPLMIVDAAGGVISAVGDARSGTSLSAVSAYVTNLYPAIVRPDNYMRLNNMHFMPARSSITDYGASSGGSYVDHNLASILANLGGVSTIAIPGNYTYAFATGVTVPSSVALVIPAGVTIAPAAGVSLWFTGPIVAGDYTIFDCSAPGSTVYLTQQAIAGIVYGKWWASGNTAVGVGRVPDSNTTLSVAGPVIGTSYGGIAFGDLTGSAANSQLPNPVTVGVSTYEVVTGKSFYGEASNSCNISGESLYAGSIGNRGSAGNATGGVTLTITPTAVKGMATRFINTEGQANGMTIFVIFNAADTVVGLGSDFSTGASAVRISGVTLCHYMIIEATRNGRWDATGVSGVVTGNK